MSTKKHRRVKSKHHDTNTSRSLFMPRLRQMPELFLRGALANETMKHLTPQQKAEVDRVVADVLQCSRLAPSRAEFIKQLGRTIGGDYREDRAAADEEYIIAVWRGVVQLLYHHSYDYICTACNQSTYLTQRNKPSPIDRRHHVCPNCRHVRVTHPGDTDLEVGQLISHDSLQQLLLELPQGAHAPKCGSPILPIAKEKKVANPDAILSDPDQLQKYMSEFIWNYFRQILNENNIRYHQKHQQKEFGPADRMAVLELVSLLGRHRVQYNYTAQSQPQEHIYHIYCLTMTTPPEVTAELVEILAKYEDLGITIEISDQAFLVHEHASAPVVEALIIRPSLVLISTTQSRIGGSDEDASYVVEHLEYKTEENPMHTIDSEEVIDAIMSALPDGDCRHTFQILRQEGPMWNEFSDRYGDREPRSGNIAEFLNTTPKAIAEHRRNIRHLCMVHEFVGDSGRHQADD